jgi:hypothetical protein
LNLWCARTDYSALRASPFADARVALKGDRRRYAASSNRLILFGSSNQSAEHR